MSIVPASQSVGSTPRIIVTDNEKEIQRLQWNMCLEIITNMRDILREQGIDFTQDLSNSFQFTLNVGGSASVYTQNAYASFVDKGIAGGHKLNFDALQDWVRIKVGLEEPELTPVTWAIINKIQANGIKPTRFVKKALKRLIGQHGAVSVRRGGGGGGRGGKRKRGGKRGGILNKTLNTIKRINRVLKKVSKTINKAYKPIRNHK